MKENIEKIFETIAIFFIMLGAIIGTFMFSVFSFLIILVTQPVFWLSVITVILIKTFL